jgi:hypothetical protein
VLRPTYETRALSGGVRGAGDLFSTYGFSGGVALTSSRRSCRSFFTILEGRTQALGMVFGAGRALSLGGDVLLRQWESLMTRFLGAVATRTSSSSLLCATGAGVFCGLVDRAGLTSTDFRGVWAGFQLGLSSVRGLALGVVGGFGEEGEGEGAAAAGRSAGAGAGGGVGVVVVAEAGLGLVSDAPGLSGSTSCCQRLILSRTLAGLLMPIAFAKSGPFMLVGLSGAPFFLWPGVPFLCPGGFSASLGSGETMRSRRHWDCGWGCRRDLGLRFASGCWWWW